MGPFLQRLRSLITPFSQNEDEKRREYILNIILLGSIFMLVILDILVLYRSLRMGASYPGIPFQTFSLLPVFFILLYVLSRKGKFILAAYLLIAAYFLSISYAGYHWGVDMPTVLLSYALIILISSILIDTTLGFIMAAATVCLNIPLWYLQFNGTILTQKQRPHSTDVIVFSALYLLIMVIAWLSNREIERSLKRARASEGDLKIERDNLEVKVEERTQELQKVQFEKIEEIYRFAEFGQLASGLFHDILNLLNALSLQIDIEPEGAAAETLSTSKQIENFIQGIRRQLDNRASLERFSLVEGIKQVIQLVAYKATKTDVRVELDFDHNDPFRYYGDPFKFHQVVINLIINAIECYEGISKENARDRSVLVRLVRSAHAINLSVQDHGWGVPDAFQEKIFEPFFTTKNGARGMGIGLASVQKIVTEDLHGTISLTTQQGEGTTFTVTFPEAGGEEARPEADQ